MNKNSTVFKICIALWNALRFMHHQLKKQTMQNRINLSSQKNSIIVFAVLLLLAVGSCKKREPYDPEIINSAQRAKIEGYLKEPKIQTISFANFTKNVNMASLGNLKEVMLNPNKASTGTLMASGQAMSTKPKYRVNIDSAKLLVINGQSNYIFSIAPVSPRAVTFRNLTISKKESTIFAFLTTYTPTRRWAKNYNLGKIEKFEGRIGYMPIDLNDNDILAIGQLPTTITSSTTIEKKTMQGGTQTSNMDGCIAIPIYDQIPYMCASGQHGPGDECSLIGTARAGYRAVISTYEYDCSGSGSGGGGGTGTTPGPPSGYNPCDEGNNQNTPGENQVPNMENDEPICNPSGPKDCAGIVNGNAYTNPNCNTCMGGTTGITECPPSIEVKQDSLLKYYPCMVKEILNKLLNNTTFGKLIQPFQDIKLPNGNTINIPNLPKLTFDFSSQPYGGTSNSYKMGETGSAGYSSKINFNSSAMNNASQLFLQMAAIHETGHAYSTYYIKMGSYGMPIDTTKYSTWAMNIVNFESAAKSQLSNGNFSDHSLFLENYVDNFIRILKELNGTNYTDKEYQMAAIYGLNNAGDPPNNPLINGINTYNIYKGIIDKSYNNLMTKYGISPVQRDAFYLANLINVPANKKLPTNCP